MTKQIKFCHTLLNGFARTATLTKTRAETSDMAALWECSIDLHREPTGRIVPIAGKDTTPVVVHLTDNTCHIWAVIKATDGAEIETLRRSNNGQENLAVEIDGQLYGLHA